MRAARPVIAVAVAARAACTPSQVGRTDSPCSWSACCVGSSDLGVQSRSSTHCPGGRRFWLSARAATWAARQLFVLLPVTVLLLDTTGTASSKYVHHASSGPAALSQAVDGQVLSGSACAACGSVRGPSRGGAWTWNVSGSLSRMPRRRRAGARLTVIPDFAGKSTTSTTASASEGRSLSVSGLGAISEFSVLALPAWKLSKPLHSSAASAASASKLALSKLSGLGKEPVSGSLSGNGAQRYTGGQRLARHGGERGTEGTVDWAMGRRRPRKECVSVLTAL